MPRDTPPERDDSSLDAALGPDRAAALRTELAAVGFAIVDADELGVLRRDADGLRRMRAIAFDDEA